MWNNATMYFALAGLSVCLLALAVVCLAPYCGALRRCWLFIPVALLVSLWAGDKPTPPPPPIVVKDIEITHYKCDHTGLEISWRHGTNVVYGTDKFIIQRATRQIPARTGWSAFTDFAETMTTNYVNNTPFHAEDNRFKVIVRKVAN